MLTRAQWQKLKQMPPAVQWWEKRFIVWRAGGYHQRDAEGFLKTLEWAIKRHDQQDAEEAAKRESATHQRVSG